VLVEVDTEDGGSSSSSSLVMTYRMSRCHIKLDSVHSSSGAGPLLCSACVYRTAGRLQFASTEV
jgi:hypothetical protein